jgi:hypothetical protein
MHVVYYSYVIEKCCFFLFGMGLTAGETLLPLKTAQ